MWGRCELPPEPGVAYSGFVDPSGGVSDSMTLAIGHLGSNNACVLDAAVEIRPPLDPEQTVAEFAVLLRRYGVSKIVGDKYGGEWPRARFAEHGIEFEQSARPKSDLYRDLLPLLNARRIELLDLPRLSAQLAGLERRTARSGRDSIDHVPGGHDDLANAVAGVLVGVDLDRRQPLVRLSDVFGADGRAPPLPRHCGMVVFAAVAMEGADVAVVFAATSPGGAAALHSRRRGGAAVAGFLRRHGGAAAGAEARLQCASGGGFHPGRPHPAVPDARLDRAVPAGLVRRRDEPRFRRRDDEQGVGQVLRSGRRQDDDPEHRGGVGVQGGRCGRDGAPGGVHPGDLPEVRHEADEPP